VYVAVGATLKQSVTNPFVGLNTGGNVIKINGTDLTTGATGGYTGSLIAVQGTGSHTVKISGIPH